MEQPKSPARFGHGVWLGLSIAKSDEAVNAGTAQHRPAQREQSARSSVTPPFSCHSGGVRATAYVRVDPEIVDRNIVAMQAFCDSRGIALRPHVKTHKSAEIAARQLAAGAVGLSVATVGEAEAFADQVAAAGKDLFLAYPVAADVPRVRAVGARVPLVVGVDSVEGVRRAADCGVAV